MPVYPFPKLSSANAASLSALCRKIMELCAVKQDEKVLIVTPHVWNYEYVKALMTALSDMGADAMHVSVNAKTAGGSPGTDLRRGSTPWCFDVYKTADFVIHPDRTLDSPSVIPEYCDEFGDLMAAGVRMLDITISPPLQRRMFPTEERTKRTWLAAELLDKAETIRIKSDSGTDLTYSKKGRPAAAQVGYTDTPGRWDHFGWADVNCAPLEDSANGTLVVEPGDVGGYGAGLLGYMFKPMKLTLKDGYVTEIEGGAESILLRRWLEQWNSRESFGTSHIGFGLHERTAPTMGFGSLFGYGRYDATEDLFSYTHNAAGSIVLAFGMNYGFGKKLVRYFTLFGQRKAPSHMHITVFNQDFYLDDQLIVKKGKIVHPQLKPPTPPPAIWRM